MTGLIIAGFHRSGTSMVGQILESHGIPLGGNLIDANEFNPFGHFEDWPVVQFHDSVLHRVGANWSTPLAESAIFTAEERRWILDYIARRERAGADWALKDPRICRFLRQWKELSPDLKVLIVYRSPAESGHSLNRRSNFEMVRSGDTDATARQFYLDPDLALKLWIEHNRELIDLRNSFPRDCIVLGHHHLLAGYDLMGALSTEFGIAPKVTPQDTAIHPEAVSKKLSSLHCIDPALMKAALDLWQDLQQHDIAVAQGWPQRDVQATLVLDPDGQQARATMLGFQVVDLRREIAEQKAISARHDAKITERQTKIAAQEKEIDDQAARIAELESAIQELRPLARKASMPPFSLYFMRQEKYRQAIENILSQ